MQSSIRKTLGFRQFLLPALLFFPMFFVGNRLVIYVCNSVIRFDCPLSWPIGVVMARIPPDINYPNKLHLFIAVVTILAFFVFLIVLDRLKYRTDLVVIFGTLLILGSTLTHGWEFGFVRPIEGMGIAQAEYYNDALRIEDPSQFLVNFENIQPDLYTHSRTHPPGAVLFFYYMDKFLTRPSYITITIAAFSAILSGIFLNKLLRSKFDKQFSGFITFLFLLTPSIQIYYAASIDAVIATFLIGALSFFVIHNSVRSSLIVATFVLLASFLSFGFIFILPVIIGYEFWRYKSFARSSLIIGILIIFYLLIYQLTGFSYSQSFFLAAALENPEGFRLIADPFNYFATRLEDIAELVFFFGPFLSIFALLGLKKFQRQDKLLTISVLGLGTLVLIFISGAYRTGETARSAIFIYPYLMLPAASYLETMTLSKKLTYTVASLVFAQTMIMQFVADFFW